MQAKPFTQNLPNKPVDREDIFYKFFLTTVSNIFRYQFFVAVSENLAGKVPLADNVLSPTKKKFILLPDSMKTA